MPDLAFLAASITLFYSLFLFGGYQAFFHDSDAGWHIRTGEQILRTGVLPLTDPFSFTASTKPWFAWEWLSDAIVGTVHRFWGLSGVALFYATAIAAGVWLWVRLNRQAGGTFLLTAAFAIPMLSTVNLHWLARPHILSWLFLLTFCWFCGAGPWPVQSAKAFLAIAALSALWANIHASFLMGPVILATYAIGEFVSQKVFAEPHNDPKFYAIAALTSLAATFLNPYGPNLHAHVLSYLTDSALLDRVGEFQSFNFHLAGSAQILLALAIAATGAVASLARKDVSAFLLIFLLLAMALRSARALPLVALLALPLANGAITSALRNAHTLNSSFRKKLDAALNYSSRLTTLDRKSSGLIWTPVILLLAAMALRVPASGFPPTEFPVAASSAIAKLPLDARILSSDKFGGYLIYRFAGQRKVFFDGRSDLYGAKFLEDYATLTQLRPNWQNILNRYNFTNALLPAGAPLIAALESQGWIPLYSDPVATLLRK